MPIFTIQDFRVETVQKSPKNSYQVGIAVYTTMKGEQKEKKIMSFANPSVFSKLKDMKFPQTCEITYVEGDQYYGWAKVQEVTEDVPKATTAPSGGKVLGSQYETREERVTRQLHIVRQSSLSNAIAALTAGAKTPPKTEDILDLAQTFVDFVYSDETVTFLETQEASRETVPVE